MIKPWPLVRQTPTKAWPHIVFSFSSFDTDITITLISLVAFIVPKFSGFVSYCCSLFIVQHVLRNKKRRNLVYHRLICGMSISDTFGSFCTFLSTVGMNSFVFLFMSCTGRAKTTVILLTHKYSGPFLKVGFVIGANMCLLTFILLTEIIYSSSTTGEAYLAAGTVQTCSAAGFFGKYIIVLTLDSISTGTLWSTSTRPQMTPSFIFFPIQTSVQFYALLHTTCHWQYTIC